MSWACILDSGSKAPGFAPTPHWMREIADLEEEGSGQAPALNWQSQDGNPVLRAQEEPGVCLLCQVQVQQPAQAMAFRGSRK